MSDRTDTNPSTRSTQARGDAARAAIAVLITLLVLGVVPPGGALAQEEDPPFRTSTYEWADVCPAGLSWTGDEPMRVPGPKPRDDEDVPMYRVGDGLYYRPGALAINGMKRVDAYLDTGDPAQLDQALKQADRLRRHALERRDAWWLPFYYDYLPAGQFAPWFNAMTQGLALSFFTRLYHVTGDETHLHGADRVFASFQRLGQSEQPWVAYVDDAGFLWLEHYPLPKPDHVLNAHLHAIFGIYEYWQATRSPAARQLLNGAVTTMRRNVERYRRPGDVSVYGLTTRTPNPKYHEIHVWQLNLLARISGDDDFAEMASRLREDQRPVGRVNGRPQRHDAMMVGPQCRPQRAPMPAPAGTDEAAAEPAE
ncbi:MAG: D-glucuronyl C5-epimerase family protein [Candidatus Limnocylindrales bacterium]